VMPTCERAIENREYRGLPLLRTAFDCESKNFIYTFLKSVLGPFVSYAGGVLWDMGAG